MISQSINKYQSDVDSIDLIAKPEQAQYVTECTTYIAVMQPNIIRLQEELAKFKNGLCNLNQIRDSILALFPDDKINSILARL